MELSVDHFNRCFKFVFYVYEKTILSEDGVSAYYHINIVINYYFSTIDTA